MLDDKHIDLNATKPDVNDSSNVAVGSSHFIYLPGLHQVSIKTCLVVVNMKRLQLHTSSVYFYCYTLLPARVLFVAVVVRRAGS